MKTWVRNGLAVSMLAAGIAGTTAALGASSAQAAPCATPGCTQVGSIGDSNGTTVGSSIRSFRSGGTGQFGPNPINAIDVPSADFVGTANVGGTGNNNTAASALDSFTTGSIFSGKALTGHAETGAIGANNGTFGNAIDSFATGVIGVEGSTRGNATTGSLGNTNGSVSAGTVYGSYQTGGVKVAGGDLGVNGNVKTGSISSNNLVGTTADGSFTTGDFNSNGSYNGTTTTGNVGSGNIAATSATDSFSTGSVRLR